MAPEEIGPRINELIDQSDILNGSFSVEAGLMLASAMVKNPKVGTALAWSGLGYSVGSRVYRKWKAHRDSLKKTYVMKVSVDDPIFEVISRWILQETPEEEQYTVEVQRIYRALPPRSATSDSDWDDLLDEIFGENESQRSRSGPTGEYRNLALEVDDNRPISLFVDGYELSVTFVTPGQEVDDRTDDSESYGGPPERYRGDPHFLVSCPSLEARKALLAKIDDHFGKDDVKRVPNVYRATSWNDMERVGEVPLRPLDTVVLKPGQIEYLVEDIAQFLRSESRYVELGIPYHHGILLYGPPGTGKTSIAAAVATALNLDVYAVSLSTITDDSSLANAFRVVKARSVLLLEDIDTCEAARGKGSGGAGKGGGVTIDGLLQTLDGFASPHGLVTIMTTNNPETLDPRMVRDGRIDTRVKIDCVDTDQVSRLCSKFLGYVPKDIPELVPSNMVSPAQVIGVFKNHLYDNEAAGIALVKKLNDLLSEQQEKSFGIQTWDRDTSNK